MTVLIICFIIASSCLFHLIMAVKKDLKDLEERHDKGMIACAKLICILIDRIRDLEDKIKDKKYGIHKKN